MSDEPQITIFPALHYRDADAALEWLKRAFGFTERVVHRNDAGVIQHAELTFGNGMVMLGQRRDVGQPSMAEFPPITIYLIVSDPDGHHDTAKAAGARIVSELADQSYGSRDYQALDPEGNLWSFGTYDPIADAV